MTFEGRLPLKVRATSVQGGTDNFHLVLSSLDKSQQSTLLTNSGLSGFHALTGIAADRQLTFLNSNHEDGKNKKI